MEELTTYLNTDLVMQIQFFCCFFMTGVIWIIQLIHYPSFKFIDFKQFFTFQNFHTKTITFIVGPIMTLEIFTALYLLILNEFSFFWITQTFLLIIIWLCTAFLSVPIHNLLAQPHISDSERLQIAQVLVKTNWPRTLLWSVRSLLFILAFKGF